jgi:hypothetical protein
MKKLLFLLIIFVSIAIDGIQGVQTDFISGNTFKEIIIPKKWANLKNGDIIFQSSKSEQARAIQLATGSKFSHCGIIYKEGDEVFVYEAVQPVKKTAIAQWISYGYKSEYIVRRLKNADAVLTQATMDKMKKEGEKFLGKNYDIAFEWSDEKIYCSELVWKIYKRGAGIEVGKPQKLREFNLNNKLVQEKLKERYGNKIPLDELVISPAAIFKSDLLVTVKAY